MENIVEMDMARKRVIDYNIICNFYVILYSNSFSQPPRVESKGKHLHVPYYPFHGCVYIGTLRLLGLPYPEVIVREYSSCQPMHYSLWSGCVGRIRVTIF